MVFIDFSLNLIKKLRYFDLRLQVGTQWPQVGAGLAHHRVLIR